MKYSRNLMYIVLKDQLIINVNISLKNWKVSLKIRLTKKNAYAYEMSMMRRYLPWNCKKKTRFSQNQHTEYTLLSCGSCTQAIAMQMLAN